jgi:hypothetical protein
MPLRKLVLVVLAQTIAEVRLSPASRQNAAPKLDSALPFSP